MSPHQKHKLATFWAPIVAAVVTVATAAGSVTWVVWVRPAQFLAVSAEQQKALEEFKVETRDKLTELERARQSDHDLLIRISNDMAWVRQALEKTKP